MNSTVRPIFNIYFFRNKVVVGPMNSALCVLHSESTSMNDAVNVHMHWEKERKKKRRKRETQNTDPQ